MVAHDFASVSQSSSTWQDIPTIADLVNKITKALAFYDIERPMIQSTHDNQGVIALLLLSFREESKVVN